MKRKTFIKKLMGLGLSRNEANFVNRETAWLGNHAQIYFVFARSPAYLCMVWKDAYGFARRMGDV